MLLILLISKINYARSVDPVTLDLLTPSKQYGEFCGYESCPISRPGMINVHLVPHTHAELGLARTFYQYYTGYDDFYDQSQVNMKRILDYTITELWSDRERKFTLGDMPYFFHWWSQRDATVRRMVYQLLRQGRLYLVGGGWGMIDEATTNYHSIIDSYTYSLRKINSTFLGCGRPLVAWQSDVFGHSREFTSLAAQMGFDGLFINPIGVDDEVSRMQRQALEFLWRGSDDLGPDSDMFTHKLFDGYWSPPGFCFSTTCRDPLLVTSDSIFRNVDERVDLFIEQILHRQSPGYNTSHVMVMMGVAFGYFDASIWFTNIDKLIGLVNDKSLKMDKKMHLMYSTPACYLRAVYDSNPYLETKQDDFFPFLYDKKSYFAGMYTSRPSLKLLAREGHVYLQMAKQLQVLAKLWNNDKKFEEFNWIMGVFQDHNVITGSLRQHVKDHYVQKMYVAIQKSTLILKQAFNKLRKSPTGTIYYRCSFNLSSCENTNGNSESFILVYNPLAWPVSMPVRLPIENRIYNVYDPNGEKINVAIMKIPYPVLGIPLRKTSADHELIFIAENIPALGYRSYYIERHRLKHVRRKRSLIKKLKKQNKKKYLIRQTNPKAGDQSLLTDIEKSDYSFTDAEINPELLILNKKYKDLLNRTMGRRVKDSNMDNSEMIVDNDDVEETTTFNPKEYIEVIERKSNDIVKYQNETDESYDYTEFLDVNRRLMSEVPPEKDNETDVQEIKPQSEGNEHTNSVTYAAERKQADIVHKLEQTNQILNETAEETTRNAIVKENTVTEERKPERTSMKPEEDDEERTRKPPTRRKQKETEEKTEEIGTKFEDDTVSRRLYEYVQSSDLHIENKYIRINLEPSSKKVSSMSLSNGVSTTLDIQLYYLASDAPARLGRPQDHPPGAYVMRSIDNIPVPILDYLDVQVYKNRLVEEVHYIYADWASLAVRVYADSPVVEVDWLVGPVPVDDTVGKEVFIRYRTELAHDGVFYTDSNGRQTMKRIRDTRPLHQPANTDKIAGNYYPVTSNIYIEDLKKNIRFSVFTDRSQGGASLYDGEIDLMLHRRILTDDSGIQSCLNETYKGKGIQIRGKHYLYLSKGDFKPNKIFEKKFAKELSMGPQVLVSSGWPYGMDSKQIWSEHVNEISFLNKKLPIGIHILTIEQWNGNTMLLRLENYLEKSDTIKSGMKIVYIKDLFKNLVIKSVEETTLAANVWLKDFFPLQWKKRQNFVKDFNQFYGTTEEVYIEDENLKDAEEINLDEGIKLSPQQIRTLVCSFEYAENF